MIHLFKGFRAAFTGCPAMFADRKVQFVDTLRWPMPVIDARYEIDAFDDECADYIVFIEDGAHQGSLRLLDTERPHILGDVFPHLCDERVPRGKAIREITRLCLPSRSSTDRRLDIRNLLVRAMVDHSLANEVIALSGVVSARFRETVLAMGWHAEPLGQRDAAGLAAFIAHVDTDTPTLLAAAGVLAAPSRIAA